VARSALGRGFELARKFGVDRKTLWRYATGARPIPPDLLPRILTPSSPQPRRRPRSGAGTRTGPQHLTRRRATQAAQTRRRRSPGGGPGGPPGGEGRPTTPVPPPRTGTAAGARRAGRAADHQKERETTDPESDATPVTRHTRGHRGTPDPGSKGAGESRGPWGRFWGPWERVCSHPRPKLTGLRDVCYKLCESRRGRGQPGPAPGSEPAGR
jgi:hypothetical protein